MSHFDNIMIILRKHLKEDDKKLKLIVSEICSYLSKWLFR